MWRRGESHAQSFVFAAVCSGSSVAAERNAGMALKINKEN
jgi:hypothetical protein